MKVIHYVESEEYLSDNRYTYGQPVRGRADILITIGNSTQAYSKYDTSRYGSKSVNVEVCMTVTLHLLIGYSKYPLLSVVY